jgi:hypothetical protein
VPVIQKTPAPEPPALKANSPILVDPPKPAKPPLITVAETPAPAPSSPPASSVSAPPAIESLPPLPPPNTEQVAPPPPDSRRKSAALAEDPDLDETLAAEVAAVLSNTPPPAKAPRPGIVRMPSESYLLRASASINSLPEAQRAIEFQKVLAHYKELRAGERKAKQQ